MESAKRNLEEMVFFVHSRLGQGTEGWGSECAFYLISR